MICCMCFVCVSVSGGMCRVMVKIVVWSHMKVVPICVVSVVDGWEVGDCICGV